MSINVLDVFNTDTFGLVALTSAINDFTPVYTYLNALGLFLDEVQYLSPHELASLIVACHEVAQRNLLQYRRVVVRQALGAREGRH